MKKHIKKNFIPVLMSGESDEVWFENEDQAWEYIYSRSCDDCKEDPELDACSAEWDVWTREKWIEYTRGQDIPTIIYDNE